jgi:hypothetical protein
MNRREVRSTIATILAYAIAALLGIAAVIALVQWRYTAALENVRRHWGTPARLCRYDYDQYVLYFSPLGAAAGSVVAELVLARRRRRAKASP